MLLLAKYWARHCSMHNQEDFKPRESRMTKIIKILLRALAVLLIGFVSAVIGFILGAIIGGNLAAANFVLVLNGQQGYEAGGSIGLILGALIGSSALLFGKRTGK
jgi:ABC-type cobalamin transport system permease subunit